MGTTALMSDDARIQRPTRDTSIQRALDHINYAQEQLSTLTVSQPKDDPILERWRLCHGIEKVVSTLIRAYAHIWTEIDSLNPAHHSLLDKP